ncbi:response regulator transcription factor [Runella aurantiaca]|uniref:DNA-binding response regulator n=1 Tax=Runella aurantiaca TaxID=2282308 RepID=A0A369IIK3_9BACT|nr:response regulator transcription factor [Runella aurantiaca]RDB07094.1 DNA-binding response regulator [Runella aurantiaca]
MSVIKVGLVDDNPTLLRNIGQNLALFEEVEIVFKAVNGQDALHKVSNHPTDIILMDIDMPEMDGIAATRSIKELHPAVKIIMLTVFDREDKIFEAIKAGATGYLMKDERPSRIVAAMEEVMEGGAPMSPIIALKTLQILRNQSVESVKIQSVMSPTAFDLSEREVEILEKIAEGLTYQQIGDKLFISAKTVRKHTENIYLKLHVHSKLDAVKIGQKNRWF